MTINQNALADRCRLLSLTRAELVGPTQMGESGRTLPVVDSVIDLGDAEGPVFTNDTAGTPQEVVYYSRENPSRKYGVGVLHPQPARGEQANATEPEIEDRVGFTVTEGQSEIELEADQSEQVEEERVAAVGDRENIDADAGAEPEPPATHSFKSSSMGISFCVRLPSGSGIEIGFPQMHKFHWQLTADGPLAVNGCYFPVLLRKQISNREAPLEIRGHRRVPAFASGAFVRISHADFESEAYRKQPVLVADGNALRMQMTYRARRMEGTEKWLVTISLINETEANRGNATNASLFQSFFDVSCTDGASFEPYPEPPQTVDDDEKRSLELLYQQSRTWGIGHNCAAGWSTQGDGVNTVFADVFPVTETASMTPDIVAQDGTELKFSMIELAELDANGTPQTWAKLGRLHTEYRDWLIEQRKVANGFSKKYQSAATKHLEVCQSVLDRIEAGLNALKNNANSLQAFRLANRSMVMQQLATKQLKHRRLIFNSTAGQAGRVEPEGSYETPHQLLQTGNVQGSIGNWRAFQLAFLLMSVPEFINENDTKEFQRLREQVELIWFPTGGGKTEAYLGVAAYSMFLQRMLQQQNPSEVPRDGTNVIMRYTLRMLTTQQFQRAAALICSMECLRQQDAGKMLAGSPFSLGLWIGGDGSPNRNEKAMDLIGRYRREHNSQKTNPLILTECPWCRAELGRAEKLTKPKGWRDADWRREKVKGIKEVDQKPILCCSDVRCAFHDCLPVLVIDEQLYESPPSLVIGTADKFAVLAYRPRARSLFGRDDNGGIARRPPNLVIQDELHLIAGPLGTMFGLYESVIDELCTFREGTLEVKPKIICSTATIRGAKEQLQAIFARDEFTLFPAPGIDISDSFFGKYAKEPDGTLMPGRMYVGVNAPDYISSQTTQVRVFSSLLVNVKNQIEEARRDPWWTNLIFYNSLRELGGSTTLFQGDIKSRMKFLKWRDGVDFRNDPYHVELSSRLKQDEIIAMLDTLAITYPTKRGEDRPLDACLASNIIEVGVDIDRLSLMCVVGQPKNTAQYIQITGRVGRRPKDRPGLVFTLYSPTKIRDKSHYEQFYSYHSRLYEQVEPTSATPFSRASLERGVIGAMLVYARLTLPETVAPRYADYQTGLDEAKRLLIQRAKIVDPVQATDAEIVINAIADRLKRRWDLGRDRWEKIPLGPDDSVLLRWPGQFVKPARRNESFEVPSSLRQVDGSGELMISKFYQAERDQ